MNARIIRIAVIAAVLCLTPIAARADGVDSVTITLTEIAGASGSPWMFSARSRTLDRALLHSTATT